MQFRIKSFSTLILGLTCFCVSAQMKVGQWRDQLPYGNTIDVCLGNKKVFAATPQSVFSLNIEDNSIERINKVNLLADVGISAIEYDAVHDLLVVGYDNGNLDLVSESGSFNLSDIKRSSIIGDKKIYKILPYGDLLYLATGIGIVVIDPLKYEVRATYFIGDNGAQLRISDIEIRNDSIFATGPDVVKTAPVNAAFLANFETWDDYNDLPPLDEDESYAALEFFGGTSFMIVNDSVARGSLYFRNPDNAFAWEMIPQSAEGVSVNDINAKNNLLCIAKSFGMNVLDENLDMVLDQLWHIDDAVNSKAAVADPEGNVWFANFKHGLCQHSIINEQLSFAPDGPDNARVRRIDCYNNNFWIAHGGIDASFTNTFHIDPISAQVEGKWRLTSNIDDNNTYEFMWDWMDAAIDPADPTHVFVSSWEGGIAEVQDQSIIKIHDSTNSSLDASGFSFFPDWVGVAGLSFDPDGNLWCSNSWTTEAIHVLKKNGEWQGFDCAPFVSNTDKITDVMAARQGYVWAIAASRGLLVYNDNGTIDTVSDDDLRLLTEAEGSGGLPSTDVFCMEEDLDGEVWVGTLQGIAIFYNPECLFTSEPCDAEQILIEQDGNIQILLETEAVSAIEIDGGNRKWVGTQNSGVYLFSSDGLEQIYHFTEENSPLLSNNISDIAINHQTGEVFFATEKGIVSFMGTGTNFDPEMESVRVFPNPVRSDFEGVISIDGLAYESDVKITDISGNVVFTTTSQGGRAIWDGKNLDGVVAANGVYLVFAANQDGTSTQVAKVAVVR